MPPYDPYEMERMSRAQQAALAQQSALQQQAMRSHLLGGSLASAGLGSIPRPPSIHLMSRDSHPEYETAEVDEFEWRNNEEYLYRDGWRVIDRLQYKRILLIGRGNLSRFSKQRVEGNWGRFKLNPTPMPENKTIRQELQEKTDSWLKDVKKKIRR